MYLYTLTAPRSMGKIPKGFTIQVPSGSTAGPSSQEVKNALQAAGINDPSSLSFSSYGNWKVERK